MLEEAYTLIADGKEEEGTEMLYKASEKSVLGYIVSQYRMHESDAKSLLHDAILIIIEQINQKSVNHITKKYIVNICRNIWSNDYRKGLTRRKRFNKYCEEKQNEYTDYLNSYDILPSGLDNADELPTEWNKALRAFTVLDEKCQELVKMKYELELSHKDIATKHHSLNTVNSSKTVLRRCVKKWTELLAKMNQKVYG